MRLFTATILLSGIFSICSCSNNDEAIENRPVKLPEKLKFEDYYVKSTELYQQLTTLKSSTVTFQFHGSSVATSDHNIKQAKAIAWATQQPNLAGELFNFSLYGESAQSSMREPLLEHLAKGGVKLRQIQISEITGQGTAAVVENLVENRKNDAELIKVTIKLF